MFSAVTDYFSGLFGSSSTPSVEKSVENKAEPPVQQNAAPSVPTAQAGGAKKGKGSKKNKSNKRKSKKSKK